MPADAAIWRQDLPGWTQEHELAAMQVEATDLWGRILAQVWGAKPAKLPKPPQITHPGRRAAKAPVTSDPAEIRRFFSQHIVRGGDPG